MSKVTFNWCKIAFDCVENMYFNRVFFIFLQRSARHSSQKAHLHKILKDVEFENVWHRNSEYVLKADKTEVLLCTFVLKRMKRLLCLQNRN